MADYFIPIEPDCTYHIFCRANAFDKLYLNDENYLFFLERFKSHISGVSETFAFNLLPNHYHFIIRARSLIDIESEFRKVKNNQPFIIENASSFIMERFSNLSNSYTKAFNKRFNRKGSLFLPLKRVKIETDSDLASEIFYVHKNAVHHGYVDSIDEWKWSSYKSLLSNKPTSLLRNEIMDFFGGRESFIKFHQQTIYPKDRSNEP